MIPRDVVKQAFQFTESSELPFLFNTSPEQAAGLTAHYGGECWRAKARPYITTLALVDGYLSRAGMGILPGGLQRDQFGSVWNMGSTSHLVEAPLKTPSVKGFSLPDVRGYIRTYLHPVWEQEINSSTESFRMASHVFGLFERAWTLRGFEQFLVDMVEEPSFCDDLLELIADWMIESLDEILAFPVDAIMLTDDYADQRGMIFGLNRFRELFLPRWKRIFDRVHKAGVYTVLHVCGNAAPALPDLIDCGLDCLESLQPEAMDVYQLKREYGRDVRFIGGLGAQSTLPFGTPEDVTAEVRRLKSELGRGGGYILAGAKGILEDVPVNNVIAYLEEASKPRS
ncbi:MAG: uroporphyrinogen decarboxylase family protein [Armatimonadota bacterium]